MDQSRDDFSADSVVQLHHLIGGGSPDWDASGEGILTISNPSTGIPIARFPRGGEKAASEAVHAAADSAATWRALGQTARGALLSEAASRVDAAVEELVELDIRETGKPVALARALAASAATHIREFVAVGDGMFDEMLPGGHRQLRDPYGVVAMIVPWNASVEIVMRTLPAILLAGNTLVIKPSERAPLAVRRLVEILDLPAGVVNVLLGDAASGRPLIANPGVGLVVHTGSVASGMDIGSVSGRMLRPTILELGGKDPVIVDSGVDVDWAADLVATGSFINAGQLCTAMERIYVLEDIAEAFISALADRARSQVVGPGFDPATTLGPLIDQGQRELVDSHVREAVLAGATVVTGGVQVPGEGFYYEPTVITGVNSTMTIMSEETFGPVAAVQVVASLDEAVEQANSTSFGLAATVLTSRAEGVEAAARISAGTVWVNAYLAGTPGGRSTPKGVSGAGVVGDRRAVLEAVSAPRILHLGPGAVFASSEASVRRAGSVISSGKEQ